MASTVFTALNYQIWPKLLGRSSPLVETLGIVFFKAAAVPLSMLMLFLIYWLLPNRKVPARLVAMPAILVGLALEGLKYFNLLTWPLLQAKLAKEYGPFVYSVSIIVWSFLAAMLVLGGAEWSARRREPELPEFAPGDAVAPAPGTR
jgi:uncharacterized BrkB/YihY/UPF0761 family membrane protein